MLYLLCLSLFLLFQANYGLVEEELLVQKLLDDGVPDDKSAGYTCITERRLNNIKKHACVTLIEQPTLPPIPTKSDWNTSCRNGYEKIKCFHDELKMFCSDEWLEYMKKDYDVANVYACYYCKDLVDFMYRELNQSMVKQVDEENNELEGLSCRVNETAGETCLTKLVEPLIAKCNNTLNRPFSSDQDRWRAECDVLQCIANHTEVVCGIDKAKEYWQVHRPKVYACFYCSDFVDYMRSYMNISVQFENENKTDSTTASTCPATHGGVQNEDCLKNPILRRLIEDCGKSYKPNGGLNQDECDTMNKYVPCVGKHIDAICGPDAETMYWTARQLKVYACWYCNDMVMYLDNRTTPVEQTDEKGNVGSDTYYCPTSEQDRKYCANKLNIPQCTIDDRSNVVTTIENAQHMCRQWLKRVKCIYEPLEAICGNEVAVKYMEESMEPIDLSYCPYCNKLIDYMESKGTKLQVNKTRVGGKGYCEKADCEISMLKDQITETCSYEDNTSYEVFCSDIYDAVTCATATVVTQCGILFGNDYMSRNYNWSTKYAKSQIKECKNKQMPSNFTLDADPAVSRNVCNAMLESVECIHTEVDGVCGGAVANETIRNMTFIISERNCPYCNEAIYLTEKYGGRLWKESNTSILEACISPNCTPREMLEYATCAYRFAKSVCHEQTAADYMRNGINITVYPCGHCNEVIEYIGKFGGQVYQADKNNNPVVMRSVSLTCPVGLDECYACGTYNAKIFVDACKETFYEATSHGHANEKVGPEYCSALHVMLKCVYEEYKAVCGHSAAKTHMQSEYPEAKSDMCGDCNASVKFMDDFGAYVYIRDLPGSAVCILNKEEEKKPISSAQFYYASSYCIYFIVFALLVHSIIL
ncbi:hypothetical protein DdX_19353 [Ditylenchus destructor]|uniref:Uncharacterized protein n=1 Tax=Ditylenchus destructor TaxID=166010 RepID=A0AAD4QXC2_9BILA|nr:hypothetical protein DdX_19353 [Ditylenchus destructor]